MLDFFDAAWSAEQDAEKRLRPWFDTLTMRFKPLKTLGLILSPSKPHPAPVEGWSHVFSLFQRSGSTAYPTRVRLSAHGCRGANLPCNALPQLTAARNLHPLRKAADERRGQ
jgi:hypothetical protein